MSAPLLRVRRGARAALHPRKLARDWRVRRELASFLGSRRVLAAYEREVAESGLADHLRERAREFQAVAERIDPGSSLGAIAHREGAHLYALLRAVGPRIAVETGVANGFSTAFSLLALERNGDGELYSIDLPREVGREYAPGMFYEGKGRTGVPPGREPGWLVPERLRERWTLILGRSQEELPRLLERLGSIDSFLHDSEHSFECMWLEYSTAWPALRPGGVLASHDVNATPAFVRFAAEQGRDPVRLSGSMAFLVK